MGIAGTPEFFNHLLLRLEDRDGAVGWIGHDGEPADIRDLVWADADGRTQRLRLLG